MANAIETVTAFLDECGKGKAAMEQAFRTYFTPTTVWENVGWSKTTGVDEAKALMESFATATGTSAFRAEMLAIASQGNRVLTERIDYMLDAEGNDLKAFQLMGIFEVEDGKISAWRDYFDTAGFANAG